MPATQVQPALYQYRLEFLQAGGRGRVHDVVLARADFDRAIEATFFEGLRRGLFTDYAPPLAKARIEPVFAGRAEGSPRADSFRVVLPVARGDEYGKEFPAEFFDRRALRIGADLVRAGRVPNKSTLLYQLAAYLESDGAPTTSRVRFTLEPESVAVDIRPGRLAAFGPRQAWDGPRPDEM